MTRLISPYKADNSQKGHKGEYPSGGQDANEELRLSFGCIAGFGEGLAKRHLNTCGMRVRIHHGRRAIANSHLILVR